MTMLTKDTDFVQVQLDEMADLDSYEQFGNKSFETYIADCRELMSIIKTDGPADWQDVTDIEDLESLLGYFIENAETPQVPMSNSDCIKYLHECFIGQIKSLAS